MIAHLIRVFCARQLIFSICVSLDDRIVISAVETNSEGRHSIKAYQAAPGRGEPWNGGHRLIEVDCGHGARGPLLKRHDRFARV